MHAEPWALQSLQHGPAWLRLSGLGSRGLTAWSRALHNTTFIQWERNLSLFIELFTYRVVPSAFDLYLACQIMDIGQAKWSKKCTFHFVFGLKAKDLIVSYTNSDENRTISIQTSGFLLGIPIIPSWMKIQAYFHRKLSLPVESRWTSKSVLRQKNLILYFITHRYFRMKPGVWMILQAPSFKFASGACINLAGCERYMKLQYYELVSANGRPAATAEHSRSEFVVTRIRNRIGWIASE